MDNYDGPHIAIDNEGETEIWPCEDIEDIEAAENRLAELGIQSAPIWVGSAPDSVKTGQTVFASADLDPELRAERLSDGWCVNDQCGQRWWPDDDAAAEIEQSEDPEALILAMVEAAPMRGEWRS